ncbi:MAG TPA: FAD-dependent oxidoreductase [Verrucomicrobiae bacterium]|nr:FAD-dependent oxidoreductase [Verrucomicrobiae bacterium]
MIETFDIAVIGSGAAGIAAAITTARAGCRTLLLDKNPAAGGTGGFSGLTTLCGLFDEHGKFLNEGFPREFTEAISETPPVKTGRVWILPYRPEKFHAVAENLFATAPRLKTRWNTSLAGIFVEENKIVSVNGFRVGAVIDCSGSAEVARATGVECLATDETTQASAVIFPLHHVRRELFSPAEAAKILLSLARAGFPPLNFQPNLEPDSVTVKFTGRPEQVPLVIGFLRRNVSGFENCLTPLEKFTPAPRAGRMIIGEYILTGADVLAGRKFPDAVARGCWPVEQWNSRGEVKLRYLPPNEFYEIPARSLRAVKIKNLFMAGKTISADTDAIASARVMGCCLATGVAAGQCAVNYLESAVKK